MTQILTLPQTKAQLEAMLSFLQPLVDTQNMATLGFGYGVCSTAGGTAAKTVDITDFILYKGAYISVLFQNAFTATSPTLNVNNKGAKPIKLYGSAIAPGKVRANTVLTLVYDGTNWVCVAIQSQAAQSTQGAIDLGLPSGLLWPSITSVLPSRRMWVFTSHGVTPPAMLKVQVMTSVRAPTNRLLVTV